MRAEISAARWANAANMAIVALLVLALGYTAYLTQPVLVPVLLAWVIGTILLPVVQRLTAWGVPRGLAVVLVVALLLIVLTCLVTVLTVPVSYWASRATELGTLIRSKLQILNQPLVFLREISQSIGDIAGAKANPGPPNGGGVEVPAPANIVTGLLSILTPAVSQVVLFIGALMFYLIYQKTIRTSSIIFFSTRETRLTALRIISDIEENMTVYFGTFTLVNLTLGLVTIGLTFMIGLPNPLLWGVLAAVLNYIPYIGVALVAATLAVVGFMTFPTLGEAAIAPLAYIAITTVEGQFLTPMILGHRLTMNPFLVFLAIAFWTWLWGPIGAFLAVPLAMTALVATRHLMTTEEKPDLPD
jgi:predicted PurR-regulated permease PerM